MEEGNLKSVIEKIKTVKCKHLKKGVINCLKIKDVKYWADPEFCTGYIYSFLKCTAEEKEEEE